MAKQQLKAFLADLGLQKLEVVVFLASLQVGSGPASTIAKVAGLNRITTYEILKRLSKQGFVKIRAKESSRVKYFVPEEITEIKAKLQTKAARIETSLATLEKVKEEFSSLYRTSADKPLVFFYEGKEGVRTALNDTLIAKPQEILALSSADWLTTDFNDGYLYDYWQGRVQRNIVCRAIVSKTPEAVKFFTPEINARDLRVVRFIDPSLFDFKNEINVYFDSVALTSFTPGSEHSIIIRSKSIAAGCRGMFNALWALSDGAS